MSKNKSKNIKKMLILICMCIILCMLYGVIHIYAIFQSEMMGNVRFQNGKWNLAINGTDILKGAEIQFVIDKIVLEEDTHVKQGKIAPGLSGSFEIVIDPKDTDVSVKYDIAFEEESLKNSNFKIKSIQEDGTGSNLVQTEKNTYTGLIPLENIKKGIKNTIKINVEWLDDGTHDVEDTALGSIFNSQIRIPVTVHASQYLGEIIAPI